MLDPESYIVGVATSLVATAIWAMSGWSYKSVFKRRYDRWKERRLEKKAAKDAEFAKDVAQAFIDSEYREYLRRLSTDIRTAYLMLAVMTSTVLHLPLFESVEFGVGLLVLIVVLYGVASLHESHRMANVLRASTLCHWTPDGGLTMSGEPQKRSPEIDEISGKPLNISREAIDAMVLKVIERTKQGEKKQAQVLVSFTEQSRQHPRIDEG
jgi:hypothetical protein